MYAIKDMDDIKPITSSSFSHEMRSSDVTDIDTIDIQGLNNRQKHAQQERKRHRKRFRAKYLEQLLEDSVSQRLLYKRADF